MLKVLDLFSGIGGFTLGLERTGGFKTVAFCEIDAFCQKVLKKHWPQVPIFEDIRTLSYEGPVDVICGGYPCQSQSIAGIRKGKKDDRWLWPEMFNCIKKHRPRWIIGENVAGHIDMELDDVLFDLESQGYSTETFVIPACAVNAPHRRDRVWIVANSQSERSASGNNNKKSTCSGKPQQRESGRSRSGEDVANSVCTRSKIRVSKKVCGQARNTKVINNDCNRRSRWKRKSIWPTEPGVGRVVNGVSNRSHRLKALGNAVVPQIPEIIGMAILEAEATQCA